MQNNTISFTIHNSQFSVSPNVIYNSIHDLLLSSPLGANIAKFLTLLSILFISKGHIFHQCPMMYNHWLLSHIQSASKNGILQFLQRPGTSYIQKKSQNQLQLSVSIKAEVHLKKVDYWLWMSKSCSPKAGAPGENMGVLEVDMGITG